jgi:type II secretory pathway component PulC
LVDPKREKDFITIVNQLQKSKENEEGMSLEAEIVKAIDDEFKNTRNKRFLTQSITQHLNENRSEGEKITDCSVSKRISRLGFEKIRFKNGRMGFQINQERLESLKTNYQIADDSKESEGYEGSEGL